jgi:isopenicillin N synthase-like dioxygenase
MTEKGDTVLRAIHYPFNANPSLFWAADHTDINLFTILPMATEKGLQVLHEGRWIDVQVPSGAFIINGGDMLQNISNGYFKSSVHRVVSQKDKERFSIVYFVHPRDEDILDPLDSCVAMTGGRKRFPSCNHKEMLAHRIVEIGNASEALKEYDVASGYMDRIKALVDEGVASSAVQKTYEIWLKTQEINK